MKTALFILSTAAVFILAQNNKPYRKEQVKTAVRAASLDSILEAGRVERMKNKMK